MHFFKNQSFKSCLGGIVSETHCIQLGQKVRRLPFLFFERTFTKFEIQEWK